MAGLVLPVTGNTILASDLGSYYNLFKGISSSGDIVTQFYKGADIASASALVLGTDGNYWRVTGTTTITSIGTAPAGTAIMLRFAGALTLTHNSTTLVLEGAANYTTQAGDIFTFVSDGSGNWREISRATVAGSALPAIGANGTILTSNGTNAVWSNTIAAGGLTITAGGLTVSASGITVTGASTITGTLGGVTTLTATTLAGTLSTAAQTNVTSVGTLTALTISGALTMSAAASQIVPGATSLSLRNNANNADNLIITDAGNATVRGTVLISGASLTVGATPATAGVIRIPSQLYIASRNAANSADINVIGLNASDQLQTGSTTFLLNSAGASVQITGGSSFLTVGGATTAATGDIRMRSTGQIVARNAGNSADQALISLDASDRVLVGAGGALIYGSNATLIGTTTALTDDASNQVATLTNAPAGKSGNPTKWIRINDNGTTRNIPAW